MLRLKTTSSPNPRIQPLVDGEVEVDGVELDWDVTALYMLFRNNLHNDDLELSEMSISETLLVNDRKEAFGKGRWDWWSLPIYMMRGHSWAYMYVNADSSIKELSDLKGKQVGIPDYCMTAAMWMRITLKDLYGIEAKDISWHNLRPREESQAIALELDKDPPPGVTVNWETKRDALDMLERGEIDAAMGLSGPRLEGNSKVRKLLPDNGREVITEFFRKTGCYQINHHFVVQRRLIDKEPEAAISLFNAFEESKQRSYKKDPERACLYFPGSSLEEQAKVFGQDPFPQGLQAMRKTLERAIQGSLEQGLIRKPLKPEDIYHPKTLAT